MSNKLIFVLVGVILIVFVVLCIYNMNNNENVNIENYMNNSDEELENKLKQGGMKTDEISKFLENLKTQDKLFLEQQKKQHLQNREIKLLKQKVDDFRNDLITLKENDKEMVETLKRDDLEEQEEESDMDTSNYSSFSKMNRKINDQEMNSNKKSNISGKSYNLNFNLDEE